LRASLVRIDVKKLRRIKDGAGKRVGDRQRRTHNYLRVADAAGVRRLTVGWEYVDRCSRARCPRRQLAGSSEMGDGRPPLGP